MAFSPVISSCDRHNVRGLSGDSTRGIASVSPSAAPPLSAATHACGFNASTAIACSKSSGVHRFVRSGLSAERNAAIVPAGSPARLALPAAARSNTVIIGFVPNTGSPVAANANTLATDHQSVISSDSAPSMISGAMNPGVPITRPVRVTWLSPSPIAMPKSTNTGPVLDTITFVGLISRCTMPAACTARTASISLRASRSKSSPTYRPLTRTSSRRFLPSINSVTIKANASSSSISTMPHTPGCRNLLQRHRLPAQALACGQLVAAAAGNRRRRGNHAKSSSHIDGRHRPAHAIPSPWHPNQAGKSTCSRQPGCLLPDSMRLSRSYFHRTWRADYARELTGWGKRHVPHVEV